jgi:DNA-binding transcriptional LysR family regulator
MNNQVALRTMQLPDLNLLPALDALLREQSVTGAARRLAVSTPAMSRTLGRLRRVTGDPLLVPAGRGLAPTPAALAMRPRVEAALASALDALGPAGSTAPAALRRTFTIRSNDAVSALLGAGLVARAGREAPDVRLRFVAEGDEDPAELRDTVDLDVGVLGPQPPDVVTEHLLTDDMVGLVRADHPLVGRPVTVAAFAATPQVTVSRRGRAHGPVDDLLAAAGLERHVALTVPGYTVAAWAAAGGDLLALVPRSFGERAGPLRVVEVPLDLPPLRVGLAWHRRLDADGGHRWLRGLVRSAAGSPPR